MVEKLWHSSYVAVNIKSAEVERLLDEVARLAGETKTEAVRRALQERRDRLVYRTGGLNSHERIMRFLERDLWPKVPSHEMGRRLSRQEEDEILGYGLEGM
jgi:antitoxin VapB